MSARVITVVFHPQQGQALQFENLELSPGGEINVAYLKDVFRLTVVRRCDEHGENAVGIPYSPSTGDSRGKFDSLSTLHITGDSVDSASRRFSSASTASHVPTADQTSSPASSSLLAHSSPITVASLTPQHSPYSIGSSSYAAVVPSSDAFDIVMSAPPSVAVGMETPVGGLSESGVAFELHSDDFSESMSAAMEATARGSYPLASYEAVTPLNCCSINVENGGGGCGGCGGGEMDVNLHETEAGLCNNNSSSRKDDRITGDHLFDFLSQQLMYGANTALVQEHDLAMGGVRTPNDSGNSTSACRSPSASVDATNGASSYPVLSEETLASLVDAAGDAVLRGSFGSVLDFLTEETLFGVVHSVENAYEGESVLVSHMGSPGSADGCAPRRDSAASTFADAGSPSAEVRMRADFDVGSDLIPAGTGRLEGIPEGLELVQPQTRPSTERHDIFLRKHVWYGPGEVMLNLGARHPHLTGRRVCVGGKGSRTSSSTTAASSLTSRAALSVAGPALVLTAEVLPSVEPIRVCAKCAHGTCKGRTVRLTLPSDDYRIESAFVGGDLREEQRYLWCFAKISTQCTSYPFSVHFALVDGSTNISSWVVEEGQLDLRIKRKESVKSLRHANTGGMASPESLFADGIAFSKQMDYGHVIGLRTSENLMFRVWETVPGELSMQESLRAAVCMRPPAATYWSAVVLHQMEQYGDALRTCAMAFRSAGWAVKLPTLVPNIPDCLPIAAATLAAEVVVLSSTSRRPLGDDELDVLRLLASIARDAEDEWSPGCRELVDWIARISHCDGVYLRARIAAASGSPQTQASALEDCREAIAALTALSPRSTDFGTRNLLANLHDLAGWLCARFLLWDDKVRHHLSALEWRVRGRQKWQVPWHDQALGSSFMSFALIAKSIETGGGSASGQSGQLAVLNASHAFSQLLSSSGSPCDVVSHDGDSVAGGVPLGPVMMITRAKRCQEDSFRYERAYLDLLRISNHDSVHTRILRTFIALREARLLMANGKSIEKVLDDMRLIRDNCHRRTKTDNRIYDSIEQFRRELDAQAKGHPPKPVLAHLFKM